MKKSIDLELLSLIGKDARQSSEALAEQLNISSATVRRKINYYLENDLLRITGVVDPSKFGYPLSVIIAIDVEPNKLESVVEELVKQPRIWWMTTTTGRYDILMVTRFSVTDEISDFVTNTLGKIKGVKDIESMVCLGVKKGRYVPLIPLV